MSRLQEKIDRLELLLKNNNRLVAKLRDALLQHKSLEPGGGGANDSSDSAHRRAEAFPGCRLAEEMKNAADGVQVNFIYMTDYILQKRSPCED